MSNTLTQNQRASIRDNHSLIAVSDLGRLFTLALIAFMSWIMPEKFWRSLSFLMASLYARLRSKRTLLRMKKNEKICGDDLKIHRPGIIEIYRMAGVIEQYFQYLREYRPKGWNPHVRICGREHIEKALESGRGGILWIAPFHYNQLVLKKGLTQAGFALSHLSAYSHGFPGTRFGLSVLSPIWIKVEEKYLFERIVIQQGGKLNHIKRIEKRLIENGLVSISCVPLPDQMKVEQKILNGRFPFATGAPSFALATRAALLPVFTIRRAVDKFEIIVETPLTIPATKSRHEEINLLLNSYAKLVESYVVQYPTLFSEWHKLRKNETL